MLSGEIPPRFPEAARILDDPGSQRDHTNEHLYAGGTAGTRPPAGVDEGSTLDHGTWMPIRGFGRSLGTGKSLLSFHYPESQMIQIF
jgi:hypothetical protein